MRLGVMGGTFDPIHHGHLVAASEVQSLLGLDEVVFVPTGEPWQKEGRDVAARRAPLPDDGGRHRLQPALHRQPGRHRPRGADLHHRHPARPARRSAPDAELFFITGADALAQILSWKDSDELFGLAQFIGVTRPGYELSESGLPADRVDLMEVPAMAISSTDCRDRVHAGEPVWYLVPDGVVQYISKHHLYAAPAPAAALKHHAPQGAP